MEDGFSHNRRNFQRYSNLFDKLGYFPISSKTEQILYDAAKSSIERLGEPASKALLDHICSINRLSEEKLLTNYDLFEMSLQRILRKEADVILHHLKTEILTHAVLIRSDDYNQGDIWTKRTRVEPTM